MKEGLKIVTFRETKSSIEKDGIYAVGTVTEKNITSSGRAGRQRYITFKFEHDGRMITARNVNGEYFRYAVIGRKYLIRYVPEKNQEKTRNELCVHIYTDSRASGLY